MSAVTEVHVDVLKRVLIANRGEIEIRIAKAATALGIESVSVYPPVDALSLHTRFTNQSLAIEATNGAAGDAVSAYLDADTLIRAARESGCDCVHPGYGFLAENADVNFSHCTQPSQSRRLQRLPWCDRREA